MQETDSSPERAPDPWQRLAAWRQADRGTADELDELALIVTLPVASWVATRIGAAMTTTEDVVQSTIARLIEKRTKIPTEPEACRRFLFAMARRVLLEFFRETEKLRQIVPLHGPDTSSSRAGQDFASSWSSASKTKMREDGVDRLIAALRTLDEVDRDILMRMKLEGESSASVGQRHGLTDGAVRMRLKKALERLRDQMSDMDLNDFFPEST